ncbi:MAG TPA: EamA family transporter [Bradyrhizobium sp.]|nr:EamA family transporter [Bradyrhizobium sp.]
MLTPFSIALVLLAAFMHASWNALLRGGADRGQSMAMMSATLGIAGLVLLAIAGLPAPASWVYVVASGVLHWIYVALLVVTYRSGDLGETYPVARGSSPALVALGGSVFADEWMNLLGITGVGLVCAGIFMLAAAKGRLHVMNLPWALATGATIAAYTVIDGIGVRASGNWIAYSAAIFAFFIAAPLWFLAKQGIGFFKASANEVLKAVGGGSISIAAYGAIIWAMQASPMGAVSALRETSVVFAALLGAAFLGERLTMQRIVACCIIAAGAVCVGWH